ncbi:uncharacterized protein LOC116163915 [Photinus pyralis]|uniref:uncharacterized protein LOC116163915 n=1 Tax=Photinus pyralis TaxID=7054 RepID=UPI0012674B4F|nr:uncharacterized protein LOC116163915 [Photinus pyralis]
MSARTNKILQLCTEASRKPLLQALEHDFIFVDDLIPENLTSDVLLSEVADTIPQVSEHDLVGMNPQEEHYTYTDQSLQVLEIGVVTDTHNDKLSTVNPNDTNSSPSAAAIHNQKLCSPSAAPSTNVSSSSSAFETSIETGKRGKRRRKVLSEKTQNKKNRNKGAPYTNYKGVTKDARQVKCNPCKVRKDRCRNKCNEFSEVERQEIFDNFWMIGDHDKQLSFINGCVGIKSVKRKRTKKENSRRNSTFEHFLTKRDGIQYKVCQHFFINTLDITQRVIRTAVKGKVADFSDQRGKHEPKHKITNTQRNNLRKFINSLPAVPSHYCRGSTTKLYLPADIRSFTNLYNLYSSHVRKEEAEPVAYTTFKRTIHKEYNIGIHVPRKDKCVKCLKYSQLSEAQKTEKLKQGYGSAH